MSDMKCGGCIVRTAGCAGCPRADEAPLMMRELEYACLHPSSALFADDAKWRDLAEWQCRHMAAGLSKPYAKKKRAI